MTLIGPRVYLFKEVMRFSYPTIELLSAAYLSGFIVNILEVKVMTKKWIILFCLTKNY